MPRAKGGPKRARKRKKILKITKGQRGSRRKLYTEAKQAADRSLAFAFTGRKIKKRDYRKLWIVRINAAARLCGTTYSRLMNGLKTAKIEIDRKILADLAINDPKGFENIVKQAVK